MQTENDSGLVVYQKLIMNARIILEDFTSHVLNKLVHSQF